MLTISLCISWQATPLVGSSSSPSASRVSFLGASSAPLASPRFAPPHCLPLRPPPGAHYSLHYIVPPALMCAIQLHRLHCGNSLRDSLFKSHDVAAFLSLKSPKFIKHFYLDTSHNIWGRDSKQLRLVLTLNMGVLFCSHYIIPAHICSASYSAPRPAPLFGPLLVLDGLSPIRILPGILRYVVRSWVHCVFYVLFWHRCLSPCPLPLSITSKLFV